MTEATLSPSKSTLTPAARPAEAAGQRMLVRQAAVLGAGCDGRADRRAPRQREREADPLRARRRRQGQEREREEGDRRACEVESRPARHRVGREADRRGELRRASRGSEGLRPRDRGDQRAHGLEEGPLREGRAAHRSRRHLRVEYFRAFHHRAFEDAAGRAAQAFCGIHFFNPPRYMRLVEIIPTPDTDPAILDRLETFLTTTLGKA